MKLRKIKKFDKLAKFKPGPKAKRVLAITACVGLIALTVWLNVSLSAPHEKEDLAEPGPSPVIEEASASGEEDYFAVFRRNRDDVREKELYYLETIANAEDTDETTVKDTQAQRLALISAMETETIIEGLLAAKGFGEVAVTVSAGSVNVVVDRKDLTDAQVAQILDIAGTESGQPAENVKVLPLN